MKISKVEHKKAAVGKQENGTRGIIYQNPSKKKGVEDLGKWVKDRSDKSANLYSVLNRNVVLFTDDRQKQRIVEKVIGEFSSVFTGNKNRGIGIYANGACDYKRVCEYIKKTISDNKVKPDIHLLGYESEEKLAEDIIAYALRNSLRKKILYKGRKHYLPDLAKKLLLEVSIRKNFKGYEKILEDEVMAFVDYVYKDRINMSTRQKGEKSITRQQDIVTSIKKRDVKVQVFNYGGEKRFMPSNAYHEKKSMYLNL